jgi:hypothetical protein
MRGWSDHIKSLAWQAAPSYLENVQQTEAGVRITAHARLPSQLSAFEAGPAMLPRPLALLGYCLILLSPVCLPPPFWPPELPLFPLIPPLTRSFLPSFPMSLPSAPFRPPPVCVSQPAANNWRT